MLYYLRMKYFGVACILLLLVFNTNCDRDCTKTICNPTAGDLLIGRDSLLRASSTCGLQTYERYCVVTLTDRVGEPKCSICSSTQRYNKFDNRNSHRIENVVSRLPRDPDLWWQSANGIHLVSIEIAFESEFQFIFTQLRFKTYRPAAMYIERSKDYGRTWQKSAYFSDNCARDFPDVVERNRNDITEVSCTSEYSSISPSEDGTLLFVATPSDLHIKDKDWIEKRNEITAITNIRVQFVRLHTFGDWKIDNNPNIRNKYYYAVSEWIIRGRCSCYGHAARCTPKKGQTERKDMVYGVCDCQHNTMGQHCQKCKDFYNDKPWLPAEINSTNECKKCECNSHSTSCHFDPVVFDLSGKKSGGICDSCLHNTEGQHCDRCRSGYFRNSNVVLSAIDTCSKCKCDPHGTSYPSICIQETDSDQNLLAGSCVCKENVDGFYCDQCKVGFWNFDKNNGKGCTECKCLMIGTLHNQGCDSLSGRCFCKSFVDGPLCNTCKGGYYNLSSSNPSGCDACTCNEHGSLDSGRCDKFSGQCKCKQGYFGRTCDEIKHGWFIDSPRYPLKFRENVQIELPPVSKSGYYNFIITMDTQQVTVINTFIVILSIDHNIKSVCPQYEDTIFVTKDTNKIVVPNKCLVGNMPIVITFFVVIEPSEISPTPNVIDVIVVPMIYPNSTATRTALAECLKYPPDSMPSKCNFLKVELSSRAISNSGPKVCNCNVTGSVNNICIKFGGQCTCLPNVVGRQCDQCQSKSYGFDARGCKNCDCEPKGSLNLQCAADTGQCPCRAGIEGRHCNYCKSGFWRFPFCDPCKCNSMADTCDKKNGQCINCRGNSFGFNCQQCNKGYYGDPSKNLPCLKCNCPGLTFNLNHSEKCSLIFNTTSYMCVCKTGYKGQYCDECYDNYYGNPREKGGRCEPCSCSENIDRNVPGSCDRSTGECKKCLYNTAGFNCEKCAMGYFGDGTIRTCKRCVCNKLGTNLQTSELCHHETGKCRCLPNVIGLQCDKCPTGFFNISTGQGCLPCECDSSNGAVNETCNALTGQCHCRPSKSGRQCDKCEDGYWGDPRQSHGCQVCRCNFEGSLFNQCDRNNGACRCRPGITGRNCDKCARGTDGSMPNCTSCGDCWLQWDQIIEQMLISIGQLQKGAGTNVSNIGLPKDLLSLLDRIEKYIAHIRLIMHKIPTNISSQVDQLQIYFHTLKNEIESLDVVKFNIMEYDSSHITKALLNITEAVANYKMRDIEGAYNTILVTLKSVIDALRVTNDAMKIVDKMKKTTEQRQTIMEQMNLERLATKSKKLAYLEGILSENLNKFNKITCNAGSSTRINLCSDACGGVGCQPNTCFRNKHFDKQCYGWDPPTFFNAHAWKLNNRDITFNNAKEIGKDFKKDIREKLRNAENDIRNAEGLVGVTFNKINTTYNHIKKLSDELEYTINNSVSVNEFTELLKAINNFKFSEHRDKINDIEIKIKSRIQQLSDRAKDVMLKSKENRKQCESLKKGAIEAREGASNLLKSIKELEDNHKRVLKRQYDTKNVILNLDFDASKIRKELNKTRMKLNNAESIRKEVDNIINALKTLNHSINLSSKAIEGELSLLEGEQVIITKRLQDIKLRTDVSLGKRASLVIDGDTIKVIRDGKRQQLLVKIAEFNKKIANSRDKVAIARAEVEIRQAGVLGLAAKVEDKLKRISSLEYEIYSKSEYQASCLP